MATLRPHIREPEVGDEKEFMSNMSRHFGIDYERFVDSHEAQRTSWEKKVQDPARVTANRYRTAFLTSKGLPISSHRQKGPKVAKGAKGAKGAKVAEITVSQVPCILYSEKKILTQYLGPPLIPDLTSQLSTPAQEIVQPVADT